MANVETKTISKIIIEEDSKEYVLDGGGGQTW